MNEQRSVAFITGAGGSIGSAAAMRLGAAGYHLVLTDKDHANLADAASRVRTVARGLVLDYVVDVARSADVAAAVTDASKRLGRIQYVFASAGIGGWAAVTELAPAEWDRVLDVNLNGTFNVCQCLLPGMLEAGGGSIVLMSSDLAIIGRAGYASYTASKTAIYGLTKSLALEFAPTVRFNAIGPGPIDTPHLRSGRTGDIWQQALRRYLDGVPIGRLGTPEDVAPVVEFLLSRRSSFMTGQLIEPNGGQVMW